MKRTMSLNYVPNLVLILQLMSLLFVSSSWADDEYQSSDLILRKKNITQPVFNCNDTNQDQSYVNFEPDIVRPMALSDNGQFLYVANSVANCLEIFDVSVEPMIKVSAISVGLSPVAVAVASENEVWVVNHHSDSISIVNVKGYPHVKRTLLVGDEPRDIVFAGKNKTRAFITTAHRGQHHQTYRLEDMREKGLGRADVWVYDRNKIGKGLGGKPVKIINLFSDTPRALAVGADGDIVYAAAFLSGNKTTTIFSGDVDQPKNKPNTSIDGFEAPKTGLIVKHNGKNWVDELGQKWDEKVPFDLPDKDVFIIDAKSKEPKILNEVSGVGTTIFNMLENPVNGDLYVSNYDAQNHIRFEGSGEIGTTVRGKFVQNRISLYSNGVVKHIDLNPHVDYSIPIGTELPLEEKLKSVSQPMQMQVTRDGSTLFLTAFGSAKVLKIDTRDLTNNSYSPEKATHIGVSGGVAGVVLSKNEMSLYVYSRFENIITTFDTNTFEKTGSTALYNPEPDEISAGRVLMYDAVETSGNGTVSCGSCHISGDVDSLAWDLGNPDSPVKIKELGLSPASLDSLNSNLYHPLKGPMTTQTFRGIEDSGSMHWRGDRVGNNKDKSESVAEGGFKEFNEAFVGLLGRGELLSEEMLDSLTTFGLSIDSPPNPIRKLDNSLTPRQEAAKGDYFNAPLDQGVSTCNSCHILDPENNLFGTDKLLANVGELVSQDMKIPHLRNMYQKVGMFGTGFLTDEFLGEQIRGFGYTHDGAFASLDDFIMTFNVENEEQAHRMSEYIMAYPSEHAPIVGQQVTINRQVGKAEFNQLKLMFNRAKKGECDIRHSGFKTKKKLSQTGYKINSNKHHIKPITFTCYPVVHS